jgi:4-alpha-glucanotransferase
VLFGQYLQWVADGQWRAARARLGDIGLMGDLPFSAGTDSADVWAHAASHDLGVSVGAPPDAFAREGQDWGLPAYRWEALHESGFRVLADRARRMASLYDAFRVDHVVGLFRTWGRPRTDERPRFSPEAPAAQAAQGEAILDVLAGAGAAIVAEDLGTIPDFVRASLARLGVPGYRVLRWEREWELPGQPFRDPARYPACSLATSGTHDVAPLGSWWDGAPEAERRALGRLPGLARLPPEAVRRPFSPAVRDAILRMLFAAGSDLLVLPILDVFGWRDRINVPATVDDTNWTYRLPWPGDRLLAELQGGERARALLRWTTESGRAADARGGIP